MKPLGYYLSNVSIEFASTLESYINDLDIKDKLGLIEWLTHDLRDDVDRKDAELEEALGEAAGK